MPRRGVGGTWELAGVLPPWHEGCHGSPVWCGSLPGGEYRPPFGDGPHGWHTPQKALVYPTIERQGMFSNPSESIPCFFIFWLVFENNSDCSASRGTRRATAVYVIQFTREPARPASREARCRAAVTRSQPAFPQAAPRPMGAVWGAGVLPLPASREACCRAAVKPRPTLTSPYAPARIARRDGCRALALP